MYPHGGFKTQTVVQIGNVLAAYDAGRISLRGLRTYFAALAAAAAREAAIRSGHRDRQKARCRYQTKELAELCRCPAAGIRRELKALERAGLLLFGENELVFTTQVLPGSDLLIEEIACGRSALRPVPLPRTAVRFIARCSKVATIKTMLAYCVRGLTLTRDGNMKGKGTAKASWIAEVFGLSLRAVRVARAELLAAGFITPDEGSRQWKLNRDGAYFTICMSFSAKSEVGFEQESAPPPAENRPGSAPPYKDRKTPSGSKNQKPLCSESSGSCGKEIRKPRLSDILAEDLRSVSRMLALHAQAVRAGIADSSPAGRLAFLAAAIHATRAAKQNAAGLFATIMRKGLWHFASQDDEDRARRSLERWQCRKATINYSPEFNSRSSYHPTSMTGRELVPLSAAALVAGILSELKSKPSAERLHELPNNARGVYFSGRPRYDHQQRREVGYAAAAVNMR